MIFGLYDVVVSSQFKFRSFRIQKKFKSVIFLISNLSDDADLEIKKYFRSLNSFACWAWTWAIVLGRLGPFCPFQDKGHLTLLVNDHLVHFCHIEVDYHVENMFSNILIILHMGIVNVFKGSCRIWINSCLNIS